MLATWQVGEVFWSLLWFTLFFIWIWLLMAVFADIFRSQDLNGWSKALWSLFVIVVPYLGVFVYLIARGQSMSDRTAKQIRAQDDATRAYIRDAGGSSSSVTDEITKAAALGDSGAITDDDAALPTAEAALGRERRRPDGLNRPMWATPTIGESRSVTVRGRSIKPAAHTEGSCHVRATK